MRGIALLLMYMAHNGGWSPLYMFAMMPIFFFLSGYLHKEQVSGKKFMHRIVFRLYVPYVCFSFLYAIQEILIGKPYVDCLWEFLASLIFGDGYMWFFPCLISIEVIVFLMDKIAFRKILLYVTMALGLVMLFFVKERSGYPWYLDTAVTMIPLYGGGILYRNYERVDYSKKKNKLLTILFLTIYLILSMLMVNNGVLVNVSINKYSNPVLFIVFSYIGVYVYMMVVKSFNIGSFFMSIGKNSVFLYGMNVWLLTLCRKSLVIVGPIKNELLVNTFISFSAIWLGLLLCGFVNKYLPFLNGRNKIVLRPF